MILYYRVAAGERSKNQVGGPLFAHSHAPVRMNRPAASLSVIAPGNEQKQDARFGSDDPDTSRLLKNSVSPTRAALRPSDRKDFAYGF
jgi:hypothetical protein